MEHKLQKRKFFRHALTAILMLLAFPPMLLFDIIMEIYHRVGFRLCGIPLIKRKEYVIIDRQKLNYLSLFDKVCCSYCSYANGIFAFWTEIGARTEKYWCAIKHKDKKNLIHQPHQKVFLEYGDEKAFRKKYKK